MEHLLSTRKRLFLTFAREQDVDRAEEAARRDERVRQKYDVPGIFARIRAQRHLEPAALIAHLDDTAGNTDVLSFYIVWYMYHHQPMPAPMLETLTDYCQSVFLERTPEHSLIDIFKAMAEYRSGEFQRSIRRLYQAIGRIDGHSDDPERDYYRVIMHAHSAKVLRNQRSYDLAQEELSKAADIAAHWRFLMWLHVVQQLGTLNWASGDPRQALELHCDHSARRHAHRKERWTWLVQSHIAASKCAMDLGDAETAGEELANARLLETAGASVPDSGYLRLYESEFERMRGRRAEAAQLLDRAIEIFSEETVYCMGLRDAWRQLCEFAHRDGDAVELQRGLKQLSRIREQHAEALSEWEFNKLLRAWRRSATPELTEIIAQFDAS